MTRVLSGSWIDNYVRYASVTEAPRKMAFWAAISTVGGALRRKVWIDMRRFRWYPNFYIIFVAPPGVVAKSTSADMAMDLLKAVPGIKFGPDTVTWPALAVAFAGASESFQYEDAWHPMSAITLVASEMGSLIDLNDKGMINFYITLWDGRNSYDKVTKGSGSDSIEAPWINMLACTTPNWLEENLPHAAIGGGFTSRCVWVFADDKEKFVPFVDEVVCKEDLELKAALINDLEHISLNLVGPMTITKEARDWYRPVYEEFWRTAKVRMDTATLEGYAARKQTMLFKTAMVISAAESDSMVITLDQLRLANIMLENIEPDMRRVFDKIGKTDLSRNVDKLIECVKRREEIPYDELYRVMHSNFPNPSEFEEAVSGAVKGGWISLVAGVNGFTAKYLSSRKGN